LSKEKSRVALLSVVSNSALVVLKVVVGFVTGSVSVFAEGLHSAFDLIAAVIAFFSVRIADRPADEGHPYGHGKVENLSGLAEALLISAAAVFIVKEALGKMKFGVKMEHLEWGLAIMALSTVVNIVVSTLLFRTAKRTDSIALRADAEHLRTDVFTSLGVFAGLGLIKLTGFEILDPLVAIAVSGLIFFISIQLIWEATTPLLDSALPKADQEKIESLLKQCDSRVVGWHRIRSRKSGSWTLIDLHIQVMSNLTVREAHELSKNVEECIRKGMPRSQVLVHIEPEENAATEDLRPSHKRVAPTNTEDNRER